MGQRFQTGKLSGLLNIVQSLGQTVQEARAPTGIPDALPTVFGPSARDVNEANRQIQRAALERQRQAQEAEQFAVAENVAEQERLQKALEFEKTQQMQLKLEDMKEKRAVAKAGRDVKEAERREGVTREAGITSAKVAQEGELAQITARGVQDRLTDLAETLSPAGQEKIRQSGELFDATMAEFDQQKKLDQIAFNEALRAGDGILDVREAKTFIKNARERATIAAGKMGTALEGKDPLEFINKLFFDDLALMYATTAPTDTGAEILRELIDSRATLFGEAAISTEGGAPQVGAGVVEDVEQPSPGTISVRKTAEETTIDEFIESTAKEQVALLKEQAGTLGIVDRFLKFLKESLPTPTEEETTRKELEGSLRSALFELRKGGLTDEEREVEKSILSDIKELRKTRQLPGFRRVL